MAVKLMDIEGNRSSSEMFWEERDTVLVEVGDLQKHFDIPERVRLILHGSAKSKSFDVGALAYSSRENKPDMSEVDLACRVVTASFRSERRYFLTALFDTVLTKGWRNSTILLRLVIYRAVLNWCDENNHQSIFESDSKFRAAYEAYTEELFHCIHTNKITPRSARENQRKMEEMAEIYFGTRTAERIVSSISVIKFTKGEQDAPETQNVRMLVGVLLHIARGYRRAMLEQLPYPWKLEMPGYQTYVFPSNVGPVKTPFTRSHSATFNYEEGRVVFWEDYKQKSPGGNQADLRKSTIRINESNASTHGYFRMNNASLAMQSYMQLFILLTGANPSELVELLYDNSLDIERCIINNSFKAVKFRVKGGRKVQYNLGAKVGLVVLKEYLELRQYVLNGESSDYLFFQVGRAQHFGTFPKTNPRMLYKIFSRIEGVFIPRGMKRITSRVARKHKNVILHELKVGTQVAADLLNHSTKTNIKSYTPSSPGKMKKEFGTFWASVKKAADQINIVEISGDDRPKGISIPTGHCSDRGNPIASQNAPPIVPDCRKQYGCLYCEHFKCHADEEDVQKLLSVKFVIELVHKSSIDTSHADKLLKELIGRISYVLQRINAISNKHSALVERIRVDVYEYGELTPFWSHRLERYEEMGVVV